MFGKRPGSGNESSPRERSGGSVAPPPPPPPAAKVAVANKPAGKAAEPPPPPVAIDSRSDQYYEVKTTIFNALIDTIDLAQLAQLDAASAREEIRDIVNEIISIKNVVMSIAEQEAMARSSRCWRAMTSPTSW